MGDVMMVVLPAFVGCVLVTLYIALDIRRHRRARTLVMLDAHVIGSCSLIEVPKGANVEIGVSCDWGEHEVMRVRSIEMSIAWNDDGATEHPIVSNN